VTYAERLWFGGGAVAATTRVMLSPFAAVFSAASAARGALYDAGVLATRAPAIPCVSVGNLTVGGTGKTPFAAWLAGRFREHVPPAITGETDAERALRKIRRTHPGLLCVTLGAHGSMLLDGDRVHYQPAFPITPVDTTGAGDVFRGAFIVALLRGDTPADILRFANAAAAVSCTRAGAIDSVPTLADAESLMNPSSLRDS